MYMWTSIQLVLSWCGRFKEDSGACDVKRYVQVGMVNGNTMFAGKRVVVNVHAGKTQLVGIQ